MNALALCNFDFKCQTKHYAANSLYNIILVYIWIVNVGGGTIFEINKYDLKLTYLSCHDAPFQINNKNIVTTSCWQCQSDNWNVIVTTVDNIIS